MSRGESADRWAVAVPLALLVVGGCALLGCFPIPGNYGAVGGDVRPEKKIGKGDSDALIRLGVSDKGRVLDVLGEPDNFTEDGRTWVYDYEVVSAYWIWPLCYGADRGTSYRYLVVCFDTAGILAGYEVLKDPPATRFAASDDLRSWRRLFSATTKASTTRPSAAEVTP